MEAKHIWPMCPRAEWVVLGNDGEMHVAAAVAGNFRMTERGPRWDVMHCAKCGEPMDIYGEIDRRKHAHVEERQ